MRHTEMIANQPFVGLALPMSMFASQNPGAKQETGNEALKRSLRGTVCGRRCEVLRQTRNKDGA